MNISATSSLACLVCLVAAAHADAPTADQKRAASAHYKQAVAFYDAGAYEKAALEFRAAYDSAPAAPLLYNIARAYQLAGMKAEANAYYEKFLQQQPDGDMANDARGFRAEIVKALDQEEADKKRMADRAQQAQKQEQADAHVKQALAHEAAGNAIEAAKEHVAAFDIDGDPEHLFAAGEAARKTPDDPETARAFYARYLNVAPNGAHGDAARAQVAALARHVDELARAKAEVAEAARVAADAAAKPNKRPPTKPKEARFSSMAANARTAAKNGQCEIATAIGDQIRDKDPDFFETVVADTLVVCHPPDAKPVVEKFGVGVELRGGIFSTGDATSGSGRPVLAQGGATGSLGGFVDLRPLDWLRIRLGGRLQVFKMGFDGGMCQGADMCLNQLTLIVLGPYAEIQPALYHSPNQDFHALFGVALGFPIGNSADFDGSNGQSMYPGASRQLGLEAGLGLRFGNVMIDGFAELGETSIASDAVGTGYSFSLAVSYSSLR